MTHIKSWQRDIRLSMQFYAYKTQRSMVNGIDRFGLEHGTGVVLPGNGKTLASAPCMLDVRYKGEPGWDRCAMFLCEQYADDATIWHEANHMSRAVVAGLTHRYKGKRRIKPPRGCQGGKLRMWYEELDCYLQGGIAAFVLRWRDLGFPTITDQEQLSSMPTAGLHLWDSCRGEYVT